MRISNEHRAAWSGAGAAVMAVFAGLSALAWQAGQGSTPAGAPRHLPEPAFALFVLGAVIGFYFMVAPLIRFPPYRSLAPSETGRPDTHPKVKLIYEKGWVTRQYSGDRHMGYDIGVNLTATNMGGSPVYLIRCELEPARGAKGVEERGTFPVDDAEPELPPGVPTWVRCDFLLFADEDYLRPNEPLSIVVTDQFGGRHRSPKFEPHWPLPNRT